LALCIKHCLSTESLGWQTPLEATRGPQPDVSFCWYEAVLFKSYSSQKAYPLRSSQRLGHIVGVAERQGDSLTFLVLDSITIQVVARSEICSALNIKTPNLCCNPQFAGADTAKPIMSSTELAGLDIDPSKLQLPHFSPEEFLGQTFVRTMDDGRNVRAKILCKIQDLDTENHADIKFLVELDDGEFDETIPYNILSNLVEELVEEEIQARTGQSSFFFLH
jgi:hypothetical protein